MKSSLTVATLMLSLSIALLLGLATPGCASVQQPDGAPTAGPVIDPLDAVVAAGIAGIVHNNPKYRPLVADVRHQLGVLLARGYTNPELVADFLAELAVRYDLTEPDVIALKDMLVAMKTLFEQTAGYAFPLDFRLDERARRYVSKAQVALTLAAGMEIIFAAAD